LPPKFRKVFSFMSVARRLEVHLRAVVVSVCPRSGVVALTVMRRDGDLEIVVTK
jgi:hypothetical protein